MYDVHLSCTAFHIRSILHKKGYAQLNEYLQMTEQITILLLFSYQIKATLFIMLCLARHNSSVVLFQHVNQSISLHNWQYQKTFLYDQ